MKGRLIIGHSSDYDVYKTNARLEIEPYGYTISIDTPLEDDFISLISKSYDFDESIAMSIETEDKDNSKNIKFLKDFQNNRIQYMKNVEYIMIGAKPKEIADYIKKNPILKDKKLLFNVGIDFDSSFVNEIYEAFGSNNSNIYFDVIGNSKLITFSEYKATTDAIDSMINEINKFNFSPMEKIMYVYDMVRNKVYVEVDEGEDKMISRNLSSSLLGDKIVCAGYAVIFRTLLNLLDIDCKVMHLYNLDRKGGHARNLIYVKDEKYDIDGVYYFDPTWGCKKDEIDNTYLYVYKYFAMTREKMEKFDDGEFIDDKMPYPIESILWDFEDKIEDSNWENVPQDMINQINYMGYLVNREAIINKALLSPFAPPNLKPTKEQVVDKFYPVLDYYDREIPAEKMLEILFNVRKMQYYTTPDKFPFGVNEFFKTVLISQWEFDSMNKDGLILDSETPVEKGKIKLEYYVEFLQESNLKRKIDEIKLAKSFRNLYENKSKKSR